MMVQHFTFKVWNSSINEVKIKLACMRMNSLKYLPCVDFHRDAENYLSISRRSQKAPQSLAGTELLISEKQHVSAHRVMKVNVPYSSFATCLTNGLFALLPLSIWQLMI